MQVTQKQTSAQSAAVTTSTAKTTTTAKAATPAPQAETSSQSADSSTVSTAGMDPKNLLARIHPGFADKVRAMFQICAQRGLDVRLQEGMRTITEQDALYAQGRTKPGAIVTNARGGSSYHNYGLAVDFVFKGSQPYGESHPWSKLGKAGTDAGLYWGGQFW